MEENSHSIGSVIATMLAGAIAGAVGDICVHPIDTLRTRLQVQVPLFTPYID